ncbi:NADH-quinone oxidoreductase subunit M [Bowdeniella nasicola]|uniref:NADH-quinone oxidoreductase subunit M n=1 Tax=Bowdeniella nasicola TaxID=208480 RepID=A0A1Q5Q2M7_9ACTO|nr:NADH-quinone oxidoreductase subunit M [Bowdeniella nasicola]OKL53870.1 NADH-quinone oxidoreductase subunit M [Bowdeniella nasicola]
MESFPWLTVLIALPALAALGLALVRVPDKTAKMVALGVSIVEILIAIVAAASFGFANAASVQLTELYPWIPQLGVSWALGVNGLALVMILLAVALVPLAILAYRPTVAVDGEERGSEAGYVALILLLEAFMVAIFAARDVFLFYVVFEAMLIPVYFLVGRFGGAKRRAAAIKFLLYSLAGGLIMLVGIIAIYGYGPGGRQGFLIDTLAGVPMPAGVEMAIFLSFFIAFAIKAPMVPVHTWLPDTAEQAPAGTSVLLVGILDKVGTFGMIMLCLPLFPNASAKAAPVIVILAVISIIWGGLMAVAERDLLRLVSYTSVSHFGFIVMGIFIGSAVAMTGSMVYMVAHGITTAGMFFIVDFLGRRGGTVEIPAYRGMQRTTPVLAGLFLVTGLASIALPGLSGFVPEYMVLMGSFGANVWAASFAVLGVIIAALYVLLPYQRVFTGPRQEDALVSRADLDGNEKTVMAPLIAAMVILGVVPSLVINAVAPVADEYTIQTDATISAQLFDRSAK